MSDPLAAFGALQRATILLGQHRPEEAEAVVREALASAPDHDLLVNLLGQIRLQRDDPAGALDHFDRAVSLDPDDPEYHANRGLALRTLGRLGEAEQAANEALRLDPASGSALAVLTLVAMNRGDWTAAEASARRALENDPDDRTAAHLLARVLQLAGRPGPSRGEIERLLQDDPLDEIAHCNLGHVALDEGDIAKAEEHFREALRLDPMYDDARIGLLATFRARSPLYRLHLRLDAFVRRFGGNGWIPLIVVIVSVVAFQRVLGLLHPLLGLLGHLLIMLAFFALMLTQALGHILVLLDRRARPALKAGERQTALALAGLGLVAAASVLGGVWLGQGRTLQAGWTLFAAMLPAAHIFDNESPGGRRLFAGLTAVLITIAAALVLVPRTAYKQFRTATRPVVLIVMVAAFATCDHPRFNR